MSFSIIIPSRTASNLVPCIKAIRDAGETCEIVVVSDFELSEERQAWELCEEAERLGNLGWVGGNPRPFCFAKNCNTGMQESPSGGAFLLNDDGLLKTSQGFSEIAWLADAHPDFGIIAPVTNVTGAREQTPHGIGLREVRNIAFVCVYVPRRTIDTVGLLDERFVTYGWEDTDYCHRVRQAGLKIGVYDDCFVDHASLQSTFRGGPHSAGDIEPGRKIFHEKWGFAPV